MNPPELGTVTGTGVYRRVEVNRTLNAPIEKVWSAITDPAEVRLWAGPCQLDPREGGRIKFDNTDCENTGKGLNGTIKIFMPPHVFEYTWNDTHQEGGLVRYDLVALDEQTTRVTIVNTLNSTDFAAAAVGWHEMLEHLGQSIATGKEVFPDQARSRELYALYETALR